MQNKHLEHPEDVAIQSKQHLNQVIDYYRAIGRSSHHITVKYDGAPAIVFGTNPENGQFFVGTKSVFNKRKIKINYTHSDIERYHGDTPHVASILHTCLEVLPRVEGVYQGDFIGFGGEMVHRSNTLTYGFASNRGVIDCAIIFCCHTSYQGESLKEMTASFHIPPFFNGVQGRCYFINCDAKLSHRLRRIDYLLNLASFLGNFASFPDESEHKNIKVAVNKCIREGRLIDCVPGNLGNVFSILRTVKHLLMGHIEVVGDDVDVFIEEDGILLEAEHEGFVHSNQYGAFKLVNRRTFSYYNFTLSKQWA